MRRYILWIVIGTLFALNLASIFYFMYRAEVRTRESVEFFNSLAKVSSSNLNNATSSDLIEISTSTNSVASTTLEMMENQAVGLLPINWLGMMEVVDVKNFFKYENNEVLQAAALEMINLNSELTVDQYLTNFKVYKVGVVTAGVFANKNLYVVELASEGMGRGARLRVLDNDGELIMLDKYSEVQPEDLRYTNLHKLFSFNQALQIPALDLPAALKTPDARYDLKPALFNDRAQIALTTDGTWEKINNYPDLYLMNNSCYYLKLADGTWARYNFDLPFINGIYSQTAGPDSQAFKITWSDGQVNESDYGLRRLTGCGSVPGCLPYVKGLTVDKLVKSGAASDGFIFYELRNQKLTLPGESIPILEKFYNDYTPWSADGQPAKKISYEEFLASHPLIYWVDPLGRVAEFSNSKYQPLAECGKPVIYLYPEKTTDILVEVNPTGGFTFTEPAYQDGWRVQAQPNGEIYNYTDQKNYPYLFWEGRGLNYSRPETGFVVKKSEVKNFLENQLAKLGLQGQEIVDFIDFWQPRMQTKNYYFITFVPQAEFDYLAPLKIQPRPDTIIRVFMDYEGLDKPIKVTALKIITPKRQGFTVIEWGGALHRN